MYFRILEKYILNEKIIQENLYTVAFYNLENLFDIYDDSSSLDDDYTAAGRKKWNAKRYNRKLKKLSSVISKIGTEYSFTVPVIIGLAEVENLQVVTDLINTEALQKYNYGIVHFDSPDERGVDVALLYQKEYFEFIFAEPVTLYIDDEDGNRDFTRDVLFVKGKLNGELIHFIINHWPSRRKGIEATEYHRIKAANLNQEIVARINRETEKPKIIIMGDFNDGPTSTSIKKHLVTHEFYNPYESISGNGKGSLKYKDDWYLFDQIILSRNFFDKNYGSSLFKQAAIFDEHFLKEWKGKRKGTPFRTYIGKWHQGGYSDHFPVYILLQEK